MTTPAVADIYAFLRNGVAPGNIEIIGDHTSGARFEWTNPASTVALIYRIIAHIEDVGVGTPVEYGNRAALTNGIYLTRRDASGSLLYDYTNGVPIRTNAQLRRIMYDSDNQNLAGSDTSLGNRWTFRNNGKPIILFPGESLGVDVSDNFAGLDGHTWWLGGYYPFAAEMQTVRRYSGDWS